MAAPEKSPNNYPPMPETVEELKRMTSIGFPIMAESLMIYLKSMILVACMGRLGTLELAGGALAVGFTNITGYAVLAGLAMGMEPLCTQAFGSKNLSLVRTTMKRTILLLLFTSLPIGFLWLHVESIMLALRQNPDVTRVAGLYCRFALPDLMANSFLHPIRIYFRSKGTTLPLMWCTFLAIILLHTPITIFLTFTLHLGVPGIAISMFIANFNTLLFLLLYMIYKDSNEEHLTPLSLPNPSILLSPHLSSDKAMLREEWRILVQLAIPSCLGVCLEWWWYELMTILTGYLPNPRAALATAAIVIQTTSLMYTLPAALSASISTRVGNELGAGRPERARFAAAVSIGVALATSLFGLTLTTLGREAWSKLFTKDSEVLELTRVVLPIIGLCELGNCPQTTCCGILRGSARPGTGATINLYSFYMVGAPVAVALGFVWKLGFEGLCYGLLAAQGSCVVSILTVVYNTDWERESLKARLLVGKGEMQMKRLNSDIEEKVGLVKDSVGTWMSHETES